MRIIAINMWGQLSTGNIASGILKTFDGDKNFFINMVSAQKILHKKFVQQFLVK